MSGRTAAAASPTFRQGLRANWRQFTRSRLALIGLILLSVFAVMAVSHPILRATLWQTSMYNPITGHDLEIIHPASPTWRHLLGTDALGRDVASMLLAATTPTYLVAITAALTTAVLGTVVGALSAVRRGWTDAILNQLSHALLLLPVPIFMLIFGAGELSQELGPVWFGVIFGVLFGLGAGAIVLRTQALQVVVRPYMDAARVAGARTTRLVTTHLLPHLLPLAGITMMAAVVGAVVAHGFASWFGQTSTSLDWGSMIRTALTFRQPLDGSILWNALLPPALALSLFAAAFYLLSVGLRNTTDPRTQKP